MRSILNKLSPIATGCIAPRRLASTAAQPIVIEAGKKNLAQSPLKIKFLVSLIQGEWVPEALSQLKFSPKHRAVDVAKIVKRAASVAKIFHNLMPEELIVKEVIVSKGLAIKRMRIMGRGRTGFGYNRSAHVLVKLEPIDFPKLIKSCKNVHDRGLWRKREAIAEKLRAAAKAQTIITEVPPS
jgi:large subunit ribosomal protein L22